MAGIDEKQLFSVLMYHSNDVAFCFVVLFCFVLSCLLLFFFFWGGGVIRIEPISKRIVKKAKINNSNEV